MVDPIAPLKIIQQKLFAVLHFSFRINEVSCIVSATISQTGFHLANLGQKLTVVTIPWFVCLLDAHELIFIVTVAVLLGGRKKRLSNALLLSIIRQLCLVGWFTFVILVIARRTLFHVLQYLFSNHVFVSLGSAFVGVIFFGAGCRPRLVLKEISVWIVYCLILGSQCVQSLHDVSIQPGRQKLPVFILVLRLVVIVVAARRLSPQTSLHKLLLLFSNLICFGEFLVYQEFLWLLRFRFRVQKWTSFVIRHARIVPCLPLAVASTLHLQLL
mmetsp:Transcript_3169/g.6650  ORF Transcript_3169/g.6650 Transcript_3169/m.6650 type:complete len:271 (+) Transcript_3169:1988-2800(+)